MLSRPLTQQLIGGVLCLVLLAGCDLFGSDDSAVSLQPAQDTYTVSVSQDQVEGTFSYALANASSQSATFQNCGEGAYPPPWLQFKNDDTWTYAYQQYIILIKCPDEEVPPRSTYSGSFELQISTDNWERDAIAGTYRMAWTVGIGDESREVYSNSFTLDVE